MTNRRIAAIGACALLVALAWADTASAFHGRRARSANCAPVVDCCDGYTSYGTGYGSHGSYGVAHGGYVHSAYYPGSGQDWGHRRYGHGYGSGYGYGHGYSGWGGYRDWGYRGVRLGVW